MSERHLVRGYDDWKAREPLNEQTCGSCGHEVHDCRCPPETEAICGWCGRPWDDIEDHDEPCAEDGGQFIGPHQKKVIAATDRRGNDG